MLVLLCPGSYVLLEKWKIRKKSPKMFGLALKTKIVLPEHISLKLIWHTKKIYYKYNHHGTTMKGLGKNKNATLYIYTKQTIKAKKKNNIKITAKYVSVLHTDENKV